MAAINGLLNDGKDRSVIDAKVVREGYIAMEAFTGPAEHTPLPHLIPLNQFMGVPRIPRIPRIL